MKWHDYPPHLRGWEQEFQREIQSFQALTKQRLKTPKEVSVYLTHKLGEYEDSPSLRNLIAQIASEGRWFENSRPYYNVWPSVIKPFTRLDLGKVKCTDVRLPLPQLLVRFPIGHELEGARAIFVSEVTRPDNTRGLLTSIHDGSKSPKNPAIPLHTINSITVEDEDSTIEDRLRRGIENHIQNDDDIINHDMIYACIKLVVAICLLGDNPDLIEQAPLESDRKKWEETHDIRLIEKAERRGKREWNVGSHIETAPGYRNAHFAVRWMGKGRETPKKPVVRPIRGCLVHRKKIEEVPTGWLDEDEE